MVSMMRVGAQVGAQLDRLTDVYEASDHVPPTLEGFLCDLVSGSCRSQVRPDDLVEAGIALGVMKGVALASGVDLVRLVNTITAATAPSAPAATAPAATAVPPEPSIPAGRLGNRSSESPAATSSSTPEVDLGTENNRRRTDSGAVQEAE